MVAAIALLSFLPNDPPRCSPKDIEGIDKFDASSSNPTSPRIPVGFIWQTLANVKKWPHFLATACVFSTWSPLTTYTPSVIMSLGFSRVNANALAAVGNLMTLPVVLLFAWLGGKSRKWGLTVMAAQASYLIALVALRATQAHVDRWGKFGLWTTVNGLAVGYHPIHNAWIQVNSRTPEERSINLA